MANKRRARHSSNKTAHGSWFKLSQRQIMTGAVLVALAIGGFELRQDRIQAAEPKPYVKIFFLEHDGKDAALKILDDIKMASAEGKPYQLLLTENADSPNATYKNRQISLNVDLIYANAIYRNELQNGATTEEASQQSEKYLRTKIDMEGQPQGICDFMYTLMNGAADMDMRVMSFERYSPRQVSFLDGFETNVYDVHDKKWADMCYNQNATLGQLMREMESFEPKLIGYINYRNEDVDQEIKPILSDATRLFPEMNDLKGKPLRAIGFLGTQHIRAGIDMAKDGAVDVRVDTTSPYQNPLSDRISESLSLGKKATEKDYYLLAIGGSFFDGIVESISETNPALADKIVNQALNLTENQLEQLDIKSAQIADMDERRCYIFNTIAGDNLLKPGDSKNTLRLNTSKI
jgi:hypothetical protein